MDDMMSVIQSAMQNPETMAQLNAIAQSLFSGDNQTQQNTALPDSIPSPPTQNTGDIDIQKLMSVASAIKNTNQKDTTIDFLFALKPFLKSEKQLKADRVIKLLRLLAILPILKESGILGGDLIGTA